MNEWAQKAFLFAEANGKDLTYDDVADFMTKKKIGATYDKSMVQKMTATRRVSLMEAEALSEITGYPLPRDGMSMDDRVSRLSDSRQKMIREILADLEAAEAVDQLTKQ